MADMKFRAKAESLSPTKTVVKSRGFEMIIDEPAELGGTNEGANPVEYLFAAYAGCLNVMAHILAQELKMNLTGLNIDLVGNLNPERLMGSSFEERAGYKEIKIVLKPETDADDATIEKWLEGVLDRCPVGDNLKNITPVKVEVKK